MAYLIMFLIIFGFVLFGLYQAFAYEGDRVKNMEFNAMMEEVKEKQYGYTK